MSAPSAIGYLVFVSRSLFYSVSHSPLINAQYQEDLTGFPNNGFLIDDFEHFLWISFHNDDDNVAIISLPSVPSCYSKFAKEWILNFQISEGDWFIFLSVNFGQLTTVLHRRELSLHNVWRVMVQKQLFNLEIDPNFVTDIVFSDFSDKPVPHFSVNYCSKNVKAESITVMRLALYVDGWIDWVG